jgi:glycosyltransferase involved in cell wall biosynthesis
MERRRRRVAVLTGIFPPDIGGPASSVPRLARSLGNAGYEVTVVTLGESTDQSPDDPCRVIRVKRGLPPWRRLPAVIRSTIRSRPDVVFANGLHAESALLPSVPLVHKIVGDWAWERARNRHWTDRGIESFADARMPARPRLMRALRSHVTRRADRVVVPSHYLGGLVTRWGVESSRVRVIPNAAPAVLEPPDRRPRRLLYVGRLVSWKHVDHVLGVLPELDGVELDVVGSGPEEEDLRRLAEGTGVAGRVHFHGPLRQEEAMGLMRENAGVLVLPSSYEGMPHVVLEAFAAGLPVVASAAGGTPEIVEPGVSGLLYPWGQTEQLRASLEQALEPDVAARLATGGAEVARRLTMESTTASTVGVLEELL